MVVASGAERTLAVTCQRAFSGCDPCMAVVPTPGLLHSYLHTRTKVLCQVGCSLMPSCISVPYIHQGIRSQCMCWRSSSTLSNLMWKYCKSLHSGLFPHLSWSENRKKVVIRCDVFYYNHSNEVCSNHAAFMLLEILAFCIGTIM